MKKFAKLLPYLFVFIVSVLLIALVVKGAKGKPIYYQSQMDTTVGGPFEASNSNSRYALTQAIVNDHSFFLNRDQAKFAAPDIVDFKGKFMSIFTPGVSFVSIPFYLVGKLLGFPQLFTYFSVSVFAIINLFLIANISRKLGAGRYASLLAGFVFLFATNALNYSQSLSQHHMSVSFLLLAVLNIMNKKRNFLNNILFGSYLGVALLMDIPNLIFMLPLIIYVVLLNIGVNEEIGKIKFSVKSSLVGLAIGLIPFIGLFVYYNRTTTGSFTMLAQTIGRSSAFETQLPVSLSADVPADTTPSFGPLIHIPFATRSELNGFYTLLISNERAWIFYSPIVLLGIGGILILYFRKDKKDFAIVLTAIVSLDILIYSMFGDPWGGWAFGPRYLIPGAAILCVTLGVLIEKFKRNALFTFAFLVILIFSIGINFVGVLTTSAVPPKVEAIHLNVPVPYTFEYNFKILNNNKSSSLIYNLALSNKITTTQYFFVLVIGATIVSIILFISSVYEREREL